MLSTARGAQLPDTTTLHGELVVWEGPSRLRTASAAQRSAGAARAVGERPSGFVAFDVLQLSETDTTGWPYRQRRAAFAVGLLAIRFWIYGGRTSGSADDRVDRG
ncbi:hypothetical protein [Streptomyces europaeiscabiei]|uniref:hypothetical protein n=1 Tax=Streptomyces europaeiscabiei TaxID=146819 RepID=UPI002E155238|nr:hypothetical protein OHB30_04015 [Streptomyces europaeiscabiei]